MYYDFNRCFVELVLAVHKKEKRDEYVRNRATYRAYYERKRTQRPKRITLMQELGLSGRFCDLHTSDKRRYMAEYRRRNVNKVRGWQRKAREKMSPESRAARWKAWADKNREKLQAASKRRYWADPEKARAATREYIKANQEKVKEYRKRVYWANREEHIARSTEWAKNNQDRRREWSRKYSAMKYRTDPQHKIASRLRVRLGEMLKKQGRKKSCSLKIDRPALIAHLEARFLPGMTWENHGRGPGKWHVDHIIPCSSFDLSKSSEVHACFALSNLQPLWGSDNIRKSNKVLKQTELPLAI